MNKLNDLRKRGLPEEEVPPTTEDLLGDIREILRNRPLRLLVLLRALLPTDRSIRTSLRGTDRLSDREGPLSFESGPFSCLKPVRRYDQCGGFCERRSLR